MKVFVVIAAYNEEIKIMDVINGLWQYPYDIVVVNDGSKDKTGAVISNCSRVYALHHIINRGQGAALKTGMDFAVLNGADVIVHFDADGQMCPWEISELIEMLRTNNLDIVLGSRFLERVSNVPFIKKCVLKLGILFTYLVSGLKLTDTHNGFRVMTRETAGRLIIRQDRMAHASEILNETARLKLKWQEHPVTIKYTDYSRSKGQSVKNCLKIVYDLCLGRLVNDKN